MGVVARLIVVSGRVQGVGFRDAAMQVARDCGVTGWVRNRRDGTVEAFAQGSADAVARFVAWCRRGPPAARVSDVEAREISLDAGVRDFEWRATV
jgi:acylphosphatase